MESNMDETPHITRPKSPESLWNQSPYAVYGCFPARNVIKWNPDGGAWLRAYKAEQERRFNVILCSNSSFSTDSVPSASKGGQKKNNLLNRKKKFSDQSSQSQLTASFLLSRSCVESPEGVASINISSKNLQDPASRQDFESFVNLYHIEASDNSLSLRSFANFPSLEDLELQANEIRHLRLRPGTFSTLKRLDLSSNNICDEDISSLGFLPCLEKLCLSCNNLQTLPSNFCGSYALRNGMDVDDYSNCQRFPQLKELHLDNNSLHDISTFAVLAGLQRLKILNLSNNQLSYVPQLLGTPRTDIEVVDSRNGDYETPVNVPIDIPLKDGHSKDEITSVQRYTSKASEEWPSERNEAVAASNAIDDNVADDHDAVFGDVMKELEIELDDAQIDKLQEDIHALEGDLDLDVGKIEQLENLHFDEQGLQERKHTLTDRSSFGMIFTPRNSQIQPFCKVEVLDLSNNQFKEEQAIVAVESWSCLKELIIWGNPVTENKKGDHRALQYHLGRLCGIDIKRKKPGRKGEKLPLAPFLASATKTNRVKDILPPIRKPNQLMIELNTKGASLMEELPNTLPPIKRHDLASRKVNTAPESYTQCPDEKLDSDVRRSQSAKQGRINQIQEHLSLDDNHNEEDGIFLTQIDDDISKYNEIESDSNLDSDAERKDQGQHGTCETQSDRYNNLLRTDPQYDGDDDAPLPSTLRGSIVALKYALENPLVFNERDSEDKLPISTVGEIRRTQACQPVQKTGIRADKLVTVLDQMRTNSTTIEENLGTVLGKYKQDPRLQKQFPQVKHLIERVQSKYSKVRVTSLSSVSKAQSIIHETKSGKPRREEKRISSGSQTETRPPSHERKSQVSSEHKRPKSVKKQQLSDENVEDKLHQFKSMVEKRI